MKRVQMRDEAMAKLRPLLELLLPEACHKENTL
ncbi:translation repressor RelE [Halopseudomonas bauzanensis]|nr:translation repressor RelE [Halopseudomonas bauzanensis]